jgi:hypothetical protein
MVETPYISKNECATGPNGVEGPKLHAILGSLLEFSVAARMNATLHETE